MRFPGKKEQVWAEKEEELTSAFNGNPCTPCLPLRVRPCLPPAVGYSPAPHARLLIAAMPCHLGSPFHPRPGDGETYFMPRQGSSRLPSELPRLAET